MAPKVYGYSPGWDTANESVSPGDTMKLTSIVAFERFEEQQFAIIAIIVFQFAENFDNL